jgi:protein O-mannosyl-transferase
MKRKSSIKNPRIRQAGPAASPPAKPATPFWHPPRGVFLLAGLLFALALWTFFPVTDTAFQTFDEHGELMMNQHMNHGMGWRNLRWAFTSLEYSNWYPLTWISHMLDFKMFGAQPWGHHLTSALLHAANAALLFLVLKRLTGALWRSLIVAALFALHPLRVESVAWISERKDVLSAFFGLIALWTYARYAEESLKPEGRQKMFYGLTLLFFACALMSKSMVVTLPCVMLLLDYWPLNRIRHSAFGIRKHSRLLLEKIPFFLLVIPVSILICIAQKNGGQFLLRFPLSFRLETALMGYARYLGKMVWPANFSVLYPYPGRWPTGDLILAGTVILAISALAFAFRRQRPYLLVGWLWYLGMLVPVIGLIPLGAESMSNRYTYLPMIGILLLAVWAIHDLSQSLPRRNAVATVAVGLILAGCIVRTRAEIGHWKNGRTLWERAIAVTQDNFMAHYCLGTVLAQTDPAGELAEYQKSVDIYPDYPNAQQELGVIQLRYGRFAEAATHFRKALQLDPRNGWAYHNLGIALLKTGRANEAVSMFLKAAEIDPLNNPDEDALSAVLYPAGRESNTITNFLAAVRADPAGFERFLDTLQLGTNYVALMNDLAFSLAINPDPALRNGKYAVRLATRACEITGFHSNYVLATLSVADAEDGRFDEAVSNAQHACSLTSAPSQAGLLKEYQALVELFRSHHPYHERAK